MRNPENSNNGHPGGNPQISMSAFRSKQASRALGEGEFFTNLLRDFKFSVRLLAKAPSFTIIAILTLALGLGANISVFSVLNGLFLRPLPVPNAQQLVVLRISPARYGSTFCTPLFRALEAHHGPLSDVFAFANRTLVVGTPNGNEEVAAVYVSGEYFEALGTQARFGRVLLPADDNKSAKINNPVVVSDAFWRVHYNGAPGAIGSTLHINGIPFTIVGIMPSDFFGADANARPQLYLPLSVEPIVDAPMNSLDAGLNSWWLRVGAKLGPGVSLRESNAYLAAISKALLTETIPDPDFRFDNTKRDNLSIIAESGSAGYSKLRLQYRKPVLLTFCLCGLVLLVACINLTILQISRAAKREREIATRMALGASRFRLAQQLVIDGFVLSSLGTIVGIAIAPLISHRLTSILLPSDAHLWLDTRIDWLTFLFASGATLVSTIVIGLLPSFQSLPGDCALHMNEGIRTTRRNRLTAVKIFLGLEVSLTMVLVIGAGLLAASLIRLYGNGLGFDPKQLMFASFDMRRQSMNGAALLNLYRNLAERIAEQHNVSSVALANATPLSGDPWTSSYHAEGSPDKNVYHNDVGPGYFLTLRIPLLFGRDFQWQDDTHSTRKIILNVAAERIFFPNENPIGKQLIATVGSHKMNYEVVGVVGDAKYADLREEPAPTVYTSISQSNSQEPSYIALIRFSGRSQPIVTAVRDVVHEIAPDIPTPIFGSMSQRVDESIAISRVMAFLLIFFAINALLVTGIGQYGILAYSIARRTNEIGIRMALGATRMQVVRLFLRENAAVTLAGSVAGLITAALASPILVALLYGTSPRDPVILVVSLLLLSFVGTLASLVPAIRAASISPIEALSSE